VPFVTERIYKNLTGEESVHLAAWPDAAQLPAERDLVAEMDRVRAICAAVMALREGKSLRTRLPLKRLTVAHPEAARLEPYRAVIAEEVNVKEVAFSDDPAAIGRQELKVNPQIGRRVGGKMKEILAAARAGDWSPAAGGKIAIAGIELEPEDFSLRVVAGEGLDSEAFDGGLGVVVLDTRVYDDLKREGWARDFVRLVQQTRKEAGLAVTDRIRLAAELPEEVATAVGEHGEHVRRETLATELHLNEGPLTGFTMQHKLEGTNVQVAVEKTAA